MRRPSLVILALSLILLNACGRSMLTQPGDGVAPMTESQALSTLEALPDTQERAARGGKNVSIQGLFQLLQQLIKSGQLKLPNSRGASSGFDMSQLNNIFSLIQGGQVNSIFGLAQGLLNLNGGNATGTGSALDTIMQLLTLALPIIMAIAPQYAPIIQAIMTIVPLVLQFIALFTKPKSGAVTWAAPAWA